jgi:hypothetical protein
VFTEEVIEVCQETFERKTRWTKRVEKLSKEKTDKPGTIDPHKTPKYKG